MNHMTYHVRRAWKKQNETSSLGRSTRSLNRKGRKSQLSRHEMKMITSPQWRGNRRNGFLEDAEGKPRRSVAYQRQRLEEGDFDEQKKKKKNNDLGSSSQTAKVRTTPVCVMKTYPLSQWRP